MSTPLIATKLYTPPPRPKVVLRHRLVERLNEGLQRKLILISAPAGYGKTTLVSEWCNSQTVPSAWLSLDEGDSDSTRFLTYVVTALQRVAAQFGSQIGEAVLAALESLPPPSTVFLLSSLLNEIATIPDHFVLVLDDYHVVNSKPVDDALAFLIEHLPPSMHLVIITREDPQLPLPRLRARGQLTELRAADLRFSTDEAAGFLNQVIGLHLSVADVATLATRTEGWIAGLQLAALSTEGREDVHEFIKAFAGDNRYIMDYLVEEVLQRLSERVRNFLLQTCILNRLTGPLCNAVTGQKDSNVLLAALEQGNLFLSPLDDKRHWFRFHPLFANVLHAHLMQEQPNQVPILHRRASEWYEQNGHELEAFQHAAFANDVERAERLIEKSGVPLHLRGGGVSIRNWLESLPKTVLDARPSLWLMYGSVLMMTGQPSTVEKKLQAAEAALQDNVVPIPEADDRTRDLVGRIASMRATLAVVQHDVKTLFVQSRRALEYLSPDNLPLRAAAVYTLGYAFQLQGDRAAACQLYEQVISMSKSLGDYIYTTAATLCLGQVQESETLLHLAAETYRRALVLAGDPPRPIASEAHLGLARISYQWNDLDAAQWHGEQSIQLARQMESVDTIASYEVFLARLRLAQGDVPGAFAVLDRAIEFVRQHHFFVHWMPEVIAAQVLTLLREGNLAAGARLAQAHELPLSRARVHLAQGHPSAALAILEPLRQQEEAKGWADERLKVLALEALAEDANGETDTAVQLLGDALALAKPGGYVRIFVDEGAPMARLLYQAVSHGVEPDYIRQLLAAFPAGASEKTTVPPVGDSDSEFVQALSERELEVLGLIAKGLTNQEIATKLYLSRHTVKVHARNIYAKLGVENRNRAAAKARAWGLLPPT